MKKFIFCAAAVALTAAMSVCAAAADISVNINGTPLETDVPAQIVNDRTMVPMRAIFEALDASVNWNAEDKSITAVRVPDTIEMKIGESSFFANGTPVELDTPAMIIDNRTFVPLRAVSAALGCEVNWDAETKTVDITDDSKTENDGIDKEIAEAFADVKRPEAFAADYADPIHQGAKYYFEQTFLVNFIENDVSLAADSLANNGTFGVYAEYVWNYCMSMYLTNTQGLVSEKEISKCIDDAQLSYDRNITVDTAVLADGTKVGVIALANDNSDVGCAYIVLFYDKDKGMRYYTLEYDSFADAYMPCFVTSEKRGNFAAVMDKSLAEDPVVFVNTLRMLEDKL